MGSSGRGITLIDCKQQKHPVDNNALLTSVKVAPWKVAPWIGLMPSWWVSSLRVIFSCLRAKHKKKRLLKEDVFLNKAHTFHHGNLLESSESFGHPGHP